MKYRLMNIFFEIFDWFMCDLTNLNIDIFNFYKTSKNLWQYRDFKGYHHLIYNNEELSKGMKCKHINTYEDGYWICIDDQEEGRYHLMQNKTELLPKKQIVGIHYYGKDNYIYKEKGKYPKLIVNGKNLLENKKAKTARLYKNNDWSYMDEDDYSHLIRNGEELTKNIKCMDVYSFNNGDWSYADEQFNAHLMRKGKDIIGNIKTHSVMSYNNGDWSYDKNNGEQVMVKPK